MRTVLGRVALVALVALAACVEEPEPSGPVGVALSAAERTECLAKGGSVGRGGLMPNELCILPNPDAGKACNKAGDCLGHCMAETRTCSPVSPQFGCFEMLMEDGQKAGLCVD
ncbi:hypothetical protein [Tabrizicola sp.]|uniref:hypothetical protein n=1 Tax=Tabrizicola sp. TaxID=2005166 RepID=UPI003D2DA274